MKWRSAPEIEEWLEGQEDTAAIADLHALHFFLEHGVLTPSYRTDGDWEQVIRLSESGEELIKLTPGAGDSFSRADLHLALFGLFFYHDPLIDCHKTDCPAILARLNTEVQKAQITWPYLFGRTLYDKFNDTAKSDRTDHIEASEVQPLTENTPRGVYQVGSILSGPFGVIRSAETRFLPPTLDVPLWHCSDTGCGALHLVLLRPPNIPVVQAYAQLRNAALDRVGPPSDWRRSFNRLFQPADHSRQGRAYFDLPSLIADAIMGPERSALLTAALQTDAQKAIRSAISAYRKGAAEGAPELVAERLNEAEQLQALLLLRDKDLVRLIDRCVLQRRIEIPPNELRSARLGQPRLGNRDRACELSALGLRAKPRLALAALHSVIWDSYERTGLMDELGWKLRRRPGIPPRGALMDYIRASDPRETIRELIISSMPVTKAVADSLEFALEGTDAAGPFTDRLLWKLGFDPKTYHEDYVRLRRRLEEFNETVLRLGEARTEDEREKIRAVGVNVFVSVEHFLQDLVSYNVWLLSSDHFLDTRFTYERKIAIAAVPSALGQRVVSGNKEFPWSMEGANALGTLLVFCQGLSEWVRELLTRDPASLARPAEDLPHFADDPERVFAFRHTALWADADSTEFQQYAKGLESILNQVSRADSAAVRNGLDHRRDDREFPSGDAMLACAARLRDALEVADLQRYIPKEFWLQSLTRDRYGQESFIFADYQGRQITLGGPAVVSGLPKPRFRTPVVIAPGNLLGHPNSELRFEIREASAYSQYWKGYPRRRKIPSPPATLHEDQTLSGTD